MFKKLLFFINTILLLGMAVVIFGFSAQPAEQSGNLSEKVTEEVLDAVYPAYEQLPAVKKSSVFQKTHHFLRKLAHFSEYCVFGCLLYLWIRQFRPGLSIRAVSLCTVLLGGFYALGDEWHQSFVSGRGPAVKDVLIDSSGVLFGVAVLSAFSVVLRRVKRK